MWYTCRANKILLIALLSIFGSGTTLAANGGMTVLSIYSSFVIANEQEIMADHVDISSTGDLHKAFAWFLSDVLSKVCDKAGTHYNHCDAYEAENNLDEMDGGNLDTGEADADVETMPIAEENSNTTNTTITDTLAEHHLRHLLSESVPVPPLLGVSVFHTVMYDIRDTECFTMRPEDVDESLTCQTIYVQSELFIIDLKENVPKVELNYMKITKKATDDGSLQKSLEHISPRSAFKVVSAGAQPYPSNKKAESITTTGTGTETSETASANREKFDEEYEVDPNLDLLLEEGEYTERHVDEFIKAEDEFIEHVVTEYERAQPPPAASGSALRDSMHGGGMIATFLLTAIAIF